jgi:hypothetical protein
VNAAARPLLSSAATIREARLQDYAPIAALLARNGMSARTREEWEHLWVNNPVYKKLTNWIIGWVAQNDDQEIVGYIGNIPLTFVLRGREIVGASVHTLVLDTRYRGATGFLLRRLAHHRAAQLVVATTANASAARLNDAFGQPRVPAGDWSQSAFWITDYQGFLASALKNAGLPRVLSYPASAVLRLRDKFVKGDSWTRRTRRVIETCSSFDERFDLFWEELKHTYPERLLATRSREVLQWHFEHALAQKRAWIVTTADGSRLVAYAIFCRQDSPERGLRRVRLVDFQGLTGDPRPLVAMLAWGLAQCQNDGIHMLEAFGFRSEKQSVIDRLAPYRRQFRSWRYFYTCADETLSADLQVPAIWDPSLFDGDATL